MSSDEREMTGSNEAGDMAAPRDTAPFEEYAAQYDAWYDSPKGRVLMATEVACLRPLLEAFSRPYLEIGVGTGRFAQSLGIEYGIDPSPPALDLARARGIDVRQAAGERIPFDDASFGGVLMAFTLCFVRDATAVMREVRRVLTPGGGLVLGLLLGGTPWAESYVRRGREGHPIYQDAHFHSRYEVEDLLEQSRFQVVRYRSTLLQPPGLEAYNVEEALEGYTEDAGFAGLAAMKTTEQSIQKRG